MPSRFYRIFVCFSKQRHAGPFSLNDGTWRHVAVTWHNNNGRKKVYVDGEEKLRVSGSAGERIPANGTLVLGQDQDSVGKGFQAHESFAGELANVNVWNTRLEGEELTHVATYCGCGQGNVVAWSDLRGNTQGNVEVEATGCRVLGRGKTADLSLVLDSYYQLPRVRDAQKCWEACRVQRDGKVERDRPVLCDKNVLRF